jgi:hypothetical protein
MDGYGNRFIQLRQDIAAHNIHGGMSVDDQLDDVIVVPQRRGLSADEIMNIECRPYGDGVHGNKDGTCGICLEVMTNDTLVVDFPSCGHVFHQHCLLPWFIRSRTCPTCRNLWPPSFPLAILHGVDAAPILASPPVVSINNNNNAEHVARLDIKDNNMVDADAHVGVEPVNLMINGAIIAAAVAAARHVNDNNTKDNVNTANQTAILLLIYFMIPPWWCLTIMIIYYIITMHSTLTMMLMI